MKTKYRTVFIIIGFALLLATFFVFTGTNKPKSQLALQLQSPSFVQAASLDKGSRTPQGVGSKLSKEAGISAYKQTSGPINLNDVRNLFRTIEMETSDYIIGSVPVPDYVEHFDVHVYVHTDGWILAYYLNDELTCKIVDTKNETIATTKLEIVISTVAAAVGEPITGLKYYDFRYPNATHILLVAENEDDGKDFRITLPPEYVYYERSWITTYRGSWGPKFLIDGASQSIYYDSDQIGYGPVLAATLILEKPHHIELGPGEHYGVLAITYRIP